VVTLLWSAAVFSIGAGCGRETFDMYGMWFDASPEARPCRLDSDCPTVDGVEYLCPAEQGNCRAATGLALDPCRSDAHCDGVPCLESGVCAIAEGEPCEAPGGRLAGDCSDICWYDDDCRPDQRCRGDGVCVRGCVSDGECPAGEVCHRNRRECGRQCDMFTSCEDRGQPERGCVLVDSNDIRAGGVCLRARAPSNPYRLCPDAGRYCENGECTMFDRWETACIPLPGPLDE